MADAWRSYLEMAYGLTKTSQKKAEKAVRDLVGKGNAKAGELQTMAEDLMASADANRNAVTKLVQAELDKALGRVGLVKAEEVAALQKRVDELEAKLASATAAPLAAAPASPVSAPVKKTITKKAVATKKTVATKKAVAPTTVEKPLAETEKAGPAKAEPVAVAPTPAVAKKTPAKKAPAKKTTARKAPAKKAAS